MRAEKGNWLRIAIGKPTKSRRFSGIVPFQVGTVMHKVAGLCLTSASGSDTTWIRHTDNHAD
jgi:hypothetical protein